MLPATHLSSFAPNCCRAILASQSEYFKAQLSGRWSTADAKSSDGQPILTEQVEPDMVSIDSWYAL
jgi:hypothetical protein